MDIQKEIDNLKVKAGYDGKPQQWQYGFDLACRELAKAQAEIDELQNRINEAMKYVSESPLKDVSRRAMLNFLDILKGESND